MRMASSLVRKKGVLALALSSSPLSPTCAFNHHNRLVARSIASPSCITLHSNNPATPTPTPTDDDDDPTLANNPNNYNHLKNSRPMRIHARLLNGESKNNAIAIDSAISSTKIIHFQRHGQGTHNQLYKEWTEKTGKVLDLSETDPNKNPLLLPDIIDAPLTPKGKDQCLQQQSTASQYEDIELIICSPLVRALETAHITFQSHLPRDNNNNNNNNIPKWIAYDGIREELGTLMCNKRQPLSQTELQFPHVDYTLLRPFGDEDVVWEEHTRRTFDTETGLAQRETIEDMSHRAYNFLVDFVHDRPEKEMAVVGHSAWLLAMTGAVLDIESEMERTDVNTMFGQAEIRSLELVFKEQ